MRKLAILDKELNTFLVFNISEDEHPEVFIRELIEEKIVSGLGTIQWQVMSDLIIRNYTK